MVIVHRTGGLDSPDVQVLLALHFAAMRSHSPPDACHVLEADALKDPAITFFTLREGVTMREEGRLLGIGALKAIDAGHGEIKSMRTALDALGRGVGAMLLERIVAEARVRGYQRLSLETGSGEEFAAALRLYERAGFVPCGPFGGYALSPFTRFLTLEL